MGIKTDPGYNLYTDDCNWCFEPGKAPKKIYATITGCRRGEAWFPDAGEAVNGTFILEALSPCLYEGYLRGARAHLQLDQFASLLFFDTDKAWNYATWFGQPPCCAVYDHEGEGVGAVFWYGHARLFVRENISGLPSIKKTLDNVGEVPDIATLAEGVVKDDGRFGIRIARLKDGTCCRVYY